MSIRRAGSIKTKGRPVFIARGGEDSRRQILGMIPDGVYKVAEGDIQQTSKS